jgi:two-component system response regulator
MTPGGPVSGKPAAVTVLLIEDNETDLFVITHVLQRFHFHFRVSHDGQDALSYLQTIQPPAELPKLVLLDLNIPKLRGLELLRRIRSDPRLSPLPVVVVTSSQNESDRNTAQKLGIAAYFRKPMTLQGYEELAPVLDQLLSA